MQEPSDAYEIVPWRPQHRAEVLALLQHLWGSDPAVRDAYMRWKYEACPYRPGPAHVALYEGRVVGFRGSVGNCWEVDGLPDAIQAVVVADLVIAPEHRADGAAKFFAWRFDNPLSRYRFLFLGRNRLEGSIVLQADTGDRYGRRLTIADWEAQTGDGLERLLRHALRLSGDRELDVWTGRRDEARIEILRAAGFADSAQRPGEWYPTILMTPAGAVPPSRPWTAQGRDLLDPSNWDLRLLYSDGC